MIAVASHGQSPGEAIRFTAEDFMDCFVAPAPRNDDSADFQFSAAFSLAFFKFQGKFSERFLSLEVFGFQDNSSHDFQLSLLLRKFSFFKSFSLSLESRNFHLYQKIFSCFHLSGFNLK